MALRFFRALPFTLLGLKLRLLDAKEVARLVHRREEIDALHGHPEIEQIAALTRREIRPDAGFLACKMHAQALAGLTIPRARAPFGSILLASRQQMLSDGLGAVRERAFQQSGVH